MPTFTQKELLAIKDMVSTHQVLSCKLSTYASQCQDQDVKQMFTTASNNAERSSQNLIQILG